ATPSGCLSVKLIARASMCASLFHCVTASAKKRRLATARGMSRLRASATGLPESRDSSRANSSSRASTASASRCRCSARASAGNAAQAGAARCAAATAASTSRASESGQRAYTAPVAGSWTSRHVPDVAARNCPSIRLASSNGDMPQVYRTRASVLHEVQPEHVGNLVQHREYGEGSVVTHVAGEDRDQAERDEDRAAHEVFRPERDEMRRTLEPGVREIQHEDGCQHAEEPMPTRQEIIAEALVFADVLREQQRAQQVKQHAVQDQEQLDQEVPLRDAAEFELEPPEMHQVQEHRQHPQQVHPPHA